MEDVNCHLCKKSKIEPLNHFKRSGDTLNVSICNGCGLVMLSPRWSAEEYRDFYSRQFSPLEIPPPEKHRIKGKHVWDRIQSSPTSDNVEIKNILDVGGGTGYIQEEGLVRYPEAKMYAIEPSDDCCDYVSKTHNTVIVSKFIEGDWYKNHEEKFDFITMRHVLEHVLDPIHALALIRKSLSQNGLFYVAVPNTMFARNFIGDKGAFNIPHVYYYSMFTLVRTMERAGFSVVNKGLHGSEIWVVVRKGNAQDRVDLGSRGIKNYTKQRDFLNKIIRLQKQNRKVDHLNNSFLKRHVKAALNMVRSR